MKNRIKQIRKEQNLTQLAFGEKLNVSKSTIESIEYGRREATDRIISDICRVFNVNEEWLRTGEGSPYRETTREEEIAELVLSLARSPEDSFTMKLAEILPRLSDEQLEALYNMALLLEKKDVF